jgi:hypothetical protein
VVLLSLNVFLLAGRFWQELPVEAGPGPATDERFCADANGDGSVDISDAVNILNHLFTGSGAPPYCIAQDLSLDDRYASRSGLAEAVARISQLEARLDGLQYLSVAPQAFQPTMHDQDISYNLSSGGHGSACIWSGNNSMVAPVFLPHRAVIREFVVYYYDDSADADLHFSLLTREYQAGFYGALSELNTSGQAGLGELTDDSLEYTVNNQLRAYSISVYSTNWNCNNLRILGARIAYELP